MTHSRHLDVAGYYKQRAEFCRARATHVFDLALRDRWLEVAEWYDELVAELLYEQAQNASRPVYLH